LEELNIVGIKGLFWVEVSNRCAALDDLNDNEYISRSWKSITENVNSSAKESLGNFGLSSMSHGLRKGA
jgi:hypothetical protein